MLQPNKNKKKPQVKKEEGFLDKVDNVLSAPSRAATWAVTKAITGKGKYVDPSEALGIDEKEHPYLKMATDIVLDPTNLIGIGAISKLGKLAKGVKTIQKTQTFLNPAKKAAFEAIKTAHYSKHGKIGGTFNKGLKDVQKAWALVPEDIIVNKALKMGAKDVAGGCSYYK